MWAIIPEWDPQEFVRRPSGKGFPADHLSGGIDEEFKTRQYQCVDDGLVPLQRHEGGRDSIFNGCGKAFGRDFEDKES